MAATTSPQIIDQLLADRRAYRWPRSPKFNLRKLSISGSDPPSVELPVRASLDRAALAGLALAARLVARLDGVGYLGVMVISTTASGPR
jgi:hypothetical protein